MRSSLRKRFVAFALVAVMIASLFSVFTPVTESLAAISASQLTPNSQQRDDYNTELSSQALAYYTGNYAYDDIEGNGNLDDLSGTELYAALHTLMTDTMTNAVSYHSLPEYWDYTDAENGRKGATLFYSDLCKNDISTTLNREHVWPKSYGSFYEVGAGADLHHLRPADSKVNSTRSNDYMGTIANRDSHKVILEQNGKTVGYHNGGVFEPLDNVKGDVARIFLYLYVKWQQPNLFENVPANMLPPMDSDDSANDGTKAIESLATLLEWNYEDPVDAWEMEQNDLIQLVQGNRNVFIDYPELAWRLFGLEVPEGLVSPDSDVAYSNAQYDRSLADGYTKPDMGKYDGINSAPTLKTEAYKVDDGDYILLNEHYGFALSANDAGTYYRQGNAYTIGDAVTDDMIWSVKRMADGTVQLSNGSKILAVGSTTNLIFTDTDSSTVVYATFNLLRADDGFFYFEVKGKDNNFISWNSQYNDFSSKKYVGDNSDHAFKLIKVDDLTEATGSKLTESDIGKIDVDRTPIEIADGNYVIYNVKSKTAMSSETVADYYRAAKKTYLEEDNSVLNPSEDIIWTVVNNGDGSFKLMNDGRALGMKNDGHSSADFTGEYTNWKAYTVKGNTALYNVERDVALWWGEYSNCDGRFQAVELTEVNIAFFKTVFASIQYGEVTPTPTPEPIDLTTEEGILKAAFSLEKDASLGQKVSLTGKIDSIENAYSEQYKNISVNLKVADKIILCYRLKGGSDLAVGDVITVTGDITNYKGNTVEFVSNSTYVKNGTVVTPTATPVPTADPTATPVPTADPTGTPVITDDTYIYDAYNLVTSIDEITDGQYILVSEYSNGNIDSAKALGNTVSSNKAAAVDITIDTDGKIKSADATVIWILKIENGIVTLFNEAIQKYIVIGTNATGGFSLNDTPDYGYTIEANNNADAANYFNLVTTLEGCTRFICRYQTDFRCYLAEKNNKGVKLYKYIEKPSNLVADGTYVIYNNAGKVAVSETTTGKYYRVAAGYTLNADGSISNVKDTEVWTIKNNDDETITITSNSGSNLSVTTGKMNAVLGEANDKWALEKQDDGTFLVKNVGTGNYLEWYSYYNEFSSYNFVENNADIYKLSFIPYEKGEVTPTDIPTPTPVVIVEPVPDEPVAPAENWTIAPYVDIVKSEPVAVATWELTKITSQKDGDAVIADDGISTVEHSSGKLVGAQSIDWNNGSYYEINTSTSGICDAAINLEIASTAAGPKYMQIMYLNDDGEYVNMPGGLFLCTKNVSNKTFYLPAELYNKENVVIRIYAVGLWRADGKYDNMTGNNYLTGLSVTGCRFETVKNSFVQITSTEQIMEMPVILVAEDKSGNLFMMNKDIAVNQKKARKPVAVTELNGNMILVEDNSNIWRLVKTDLGYALRDADGKYLPMSNADNACFKSGSNSDTITTDGKCEYVINEDEDGAFYITTAAPNLAEKNIRSISAYISGSNIVDFRGYVKTNKTSYNKLYIYRLADCNLYGHIYDTTVIDASCTEDGSVTNVCTVCGETHTDVISATGHSYETVVTDPTCEEGGYTTYTCTVCEDTYVADYTDALGHDYVLTDTVASTSFDKGYLEYTCSRCGDSYRDEISEELPFVITSDWGNGFTAEVNVCNTSAETVDKWLVELSMEGTITSIWNAEIVSAETVDGITKYILKDAEWNRTIKSGSCTTFGFCASGKAASLENVFASRVEKEIIVTADAVEFVVTASWNGGFNANIVITNITDTAITNWSIEGDFGCAINSIWNGKLVSCENGHVVIENADYNKTIAAGASVTVGFNASGSPEQIANIVAVLAK